MKTMDKQTKLKETMKAKTFKEKAMREIKSAIESAKKGVFLF